MENKTSIHESNIYIYIQYSRDIVLSQQSCPVMPINHTNHVASLEPPLDGVE